MIPFIERFLEIQKLNKIIISLKNYYVRFHLTYVWRTLRKDSLKTTKGYFENYDNSNLAFSTSSYFFIRLALPCNSLKSQTH